VFDLIFNQYFAWSGLIVKARSIKVTRNLSSIWDTLSMGRHTDFMMGWSRVGTDTPVRCYHNTVTDSPNWRPKN